jgi:hypothetical protein
VTERRRRAQIDARIESAHTDLVRFLTNTVTLAQYRPAMKRGTDYVHAGAFNVGKKDVLRQLASLENDAFATGSKYICGGKPFRLLQAPSLSSSPRSDSRPPCLLCCAAVLPVQM